MISGLLILTSNYTLLDQVPNFQRDIKHGCPNGYNYRAYYEDGDYMIDVLDRITQLRLERNWTEYQLAIRSELPQSTISSWYRKNMLPSISSLEKICKAFDITMSQFFIESTDCYVATDEESEVLVEWHRLDEDQRVALYSFLKTL